MNNARFTSHLQSPRHNSKSFFNAIKVLGLKFIRKTKIYDLIKKRAISSWYYRYENEYPSSHFIKPNERSIEYRFVFHSLLNSYHRSILDVGTGTTALPHLLTTCGFRVTAIDKIHGLFNRHYYVMQDDITNTRISDKFDFITCVSGLEHIPNHRDAIRCMFKLLVPGGHLCITFPYNEKKYIYNVYKLQESIVGNHINYICQSYSRDEIDGWLDTNGGKIVLQEYWKCWSGDFWSCGEKLFPPQQVDKHEKHQLTCILIQKQ